MTGTYVATLTPNEVLGIETVLKNDDREEVMPNAKSLLLKVGSAFVEQQSGGIQEVTIAFTEPELWLLRDKVSTSLRVGNEMVGLNIKKKVYLGLLEFDSARAAPSLDANPDTVDRGRDDEGLLEWQKKEQGMRGGESHA